MMHQFEDVSSAVAEWARVLDGQFEVLPGHSTHRRCFASKQGGIVEVSLSCHDTLDPRVPDAALHIIQILDVAISEYWHTDGFSVGNDTYQIKLFESKGGI